MSTRAWGSTWEPEPTTCVQRSSTNSRWQDQAEHPLAGPDTAAARVLVRTCEGLLAVTAIAETA